MSEYTCPRCGGVAKLFDSRHHYARCEACATLIQVQAPSEREPLEPPAHITVRRTTPALLADGDPYRTAAPRPEMTLSWGRASHKDRRKKLTLAGLYALLGVGAYFSHSFLAVTYAILALLLTAEGWEWMRDPHSLQLSDGEIRLRRRQLGSLRTKRTVPVDAVSDLRCVCEKTRVDGSWRYDVRLLTGINDEVNVASFPTPSDAVFFAEQLSGALGLDDEDDEAEPERLSEDGQFGDGMDKATNSND